MFTQGGGAFVLLRPVPGRNHQWACFPPTPIRHQPSGGWYMGGTRGAQNKKAQGASMHIR